MSEKAMQLDDFVDFSICRGMEERCRFSLTTNASVLEELKAVVLNSSLVKQLMLGADGKLKSHARLRIGIAACPNACSMPQIKHLGIIARRRPSRIALGCTGCGLCIERCTEGALTLCERQAVLDRDACIGCGQCLTACPLQLIGSCDTFYELWIGGTLGRHARLAYSVGEYDRASLLPTINRALTLLTPLVEQGLTLSQAVRHLAPADWQKVVHPGENNADGSALA